MYVWLKQEMTLRGRSLGDSSVALPRVREKRMKKKLIEALKPKAC
jgi:hypothetical protein